MDPSQLSRAERGLRHLPLDKLLDVLEVVEAWDLHRLIAPFVTGDAPLRTVREAQGLRLETAAERAGIDPSHLSRVERGRTPSLPALIRITDAVGLRDLHQLLAALPGTEEVLAA